MHNKDTDFNKRSIPDYARWFSGKTVLVTGTTSGIGREITRLLSFFGAKLLLCGRNVEAMNLLIEELKTIASPPLEVFLGDFSDSKSLQELIARVNETYEVDILINNAGFGYINDFYLMPEETIYSMQDVNNRAVVGLCRAFLPKMVGKRGTGILNLGSTASFFATPGSALYGATKQFILGFTDALHYEMLSKGVHVTGVYPGHTETRFLERLTDGREKNWEKAMAPATVAKIGLKGLSANKIRVIPGFVNKIKVLASSVLPIVILMNRVHKNAVRHYPKG